MARARQATSSPPAPKRADLVSDLNRAVREATALGVIFGQAVAGRLGVNGTDLECLDVIGSGDNVTAGDIARALNLTTGAVTGVIDRLEKAGLARRERDSEDRRKVYVRITAAARKKAGAYYGPLAGAADQLAGTYSIRDLQVLIDYFTRSRTLMLAQIDRLKTTR